MNWHLQEKKKKTKKHQNNFKDLLSPSHQTLQKSYWQQSNSMNLPPSASYKPSLMYKGPLDERYILHNLGADPVKLASEMALSVKKKDSHIKCD